MELEKAYSLSDFYIQMVDSLKTIPDICQLHDKMCIDLCRQMKGMQKEHVISKPVVLCIDYIYSHLHCRITLREIAQTLGLSESYIPKLFKKEMGISLSDYISELKIEKAKNLLQYSDYTITDIANYLAFSSESHFIQVFQKIVKMTPLQYRKYHFHAKWDGINDHHSG